MTIEANSMEGSFLVYSLGVYIYNIRKRSVDDTVSVCADGVYISYGRNPNGTVQLKHTHTHTHTHTEHNIPCN